MSAFKYIVVLIVDVIMMIAVMSMAEKMAVMCGASQILMIVTGLVAALAASVYLQSVRPMLRQSKKQCCDHQSNEGDSQ